MSKEYLIEFILELVIEGGLEAAKSNKVPGTIALLFIFVVRTIYLTAF